MWLLVRDGFFYFVVVGELLVGKKRLLGCYIVWRGVFWKVDRCFYRLGSEGSGKVRVVGLRVVI